MRALPSSRSIAERLRAHAVLNFLVRRDGNSTTQVSSNRMNLFTKSAQTWALAIVSTLLLTETFFVLFPAQERPEARTPFTIKFSGAEGSQIMRFDFDRDEDPELVYSIKLRNDLTMWIPRGTIMHYEEPDAYHGLPAPASPR